MHVYIAYRNLRDNFLQNNACGGVPVNNDYRFTHANDTDRFLLTLSGSNYAVSKEAGNKFIEDVLSKCTGEHRGFFPLIPSLNGKETAAVVETERNVDMNGRTMKQHVYMDMDDEVLLQMLEDLKAGSGAPLDERELINYCYPNEVLPEGDFALDSIYHGIYCKPENKAISVVQTNFPDKKESSFRVMKDGMAVCLREEDSNVTYTVPAELLPEIKEKVRQLCKEPAEAYVEHGNWEGYIKFDGGKRIFTDPDKTLELLKDIASKSKVSSTETVNMRNKYPVYQLPNGFVSGYGIGFTGMMNMNIAAQPAPSRAPAPDGPKCVMCGADVTGKKFCSECGRKVTED